MSVNGHRKIRLRFRQPFPRKYRFLFVRFIQIMILNIHKEKKGDVLCLIRKLLSLGIAPIGWCNDDMPELGGENTFQQTVSEMALAGFTGCEIGNKYPTDPAELKKALDLRGMRIASRWYSVPSSSTRPMEQVARRTSIASLDFLAAVGANRINVSEQSYSIQGQGGRARPHRRPASMS